MQPQIDVNDLPIRSHLIAWEEFIELTDSTPERIRELMDMGWLTPMQTAESVFIFEYDDACRLRKLERLCADFELHTLGGSIIVDLLERIELLEHRLRMSQNGYA